MSLPERSHERRAGNVISEASIVGMLLYGHLRDVSCSHAGALSASAKQAYCVSIFGSLLHCRAQQAALLERRSCQGCCGKGTMDRSHSGHKGALLPSTREMYSLFGAWRKHMSIQQAPGCASCGHKMRQQVAHHVCHFAAGRAPKGARALPESLCRSEPAGAAVPSPSPAMQKSTGRTPPALAVSETAGS